MAARDVFVIGAGPNGLAAAIIMAQAGYSVAVWEAASIVGGAARSAEVTLPGFVHDLGSAVHPLAVASPFFRSLPLEEHGLSWVHAAAPLAHPLDDGSAVVLDRSVEQTARGLGEDGPAYRRLLRPLVRHWESLLEDVLAPAHWPRHPLHAAEFALRAMGSATALAGNHFRGAPARALFAGLAAHSMLPLSQSVTAGVALLLGCAAHAVGWPFPRGGAQQISASLAAHLRALGGNIFTGARVQSLAEFPPAGAVLCDVSPRQLLRLAGDRMPPGYRRCLQRYRYGPGAFKVDWALDGPIPWRAPECARAGTVHVGGPIEEIAASEDAVWHGRPAERPFVILAQPSLFDPSRAPEGRHTAWAYCHVPHASDFDMLERIEAQIERFAPGFRQRVLARNVMTPAALEAHNPNLVGGCINGGVQDWRQLFLRPNWRLYGTPLPKVFLCSSSTPPGRGVHGMCGFFAARRALRECSRVSRFQGFKGGKLQATSSKQPARTFKL
jgi:phytoene dehydrogenase-like protein